MFTDSLGDVFTKYGLLGEMTFAGLLRMDAFWSNLKPIIGFVYILPNHRLKQCQVKNKQIVVCCLNMSMNLFS